MKVILFLLWCGCAIAQIPSNGYYLLIHKKGKSKGETLGAGVPIKIAIRDSTNKAVWLWSEIESVGRDNLKISSFSKPVAFQNIAFITSKAHFQTRKLKYASAVPGGLLITASGLTMGLVVRRRAFALAYLLRFWSGFANSLWNSDLQWNLFDERPNSPFQTALSDYSMNVLTVPA